MTAALAMTSALALSAGWAIPPPGEVGCLGCHLDGPPAGGGASAEAAAREAVEALQAGDAERARRAIAGWPRLDRAPVSVRYAGGLVSLFERRYHEAAGLLASAGAAESEAFRAAAAGARLAQALARGGEGGVEVLHPRGADALVAPLLDAIRRQEAALAPLLGATLPRPVAVEVVAARADLALLAGVSRAEAERSGTIAVSALGKMVLLAPAGGAADLAFLDAAAHEVTHLALTRATRNRAPAWLQEGAARLLQGRWRGAAYEPAPETLAGLRRAAEAGRLAPVTALHGSLARLANERAALGQAQAALAVEDLARRAGEGGLARLAARLAAGASPEAAVAEVAGVPLAALAAGWNEALLRAPLDPLALRALHALRARDAARAPGYGGTP